MSRIGIAVFVTLSDRQIDEINGVGGWSGPTGTAYLDAKSKADYAGAMRLGMMHPVAAVRADGPESVWVALQNGVPRPADVEIIWETPRRRSMDVGDLIHWDDGTIERVASIGFEPWPVWKFEPVSA